MPEQVLPVQGLHTVGVIRDMPPISLPPNAFTDVLNVRFDNGSVSKMPGERDIISSTVLSGITGDIVHIANWVNPNISPLQNYYLVVGRSNSMDTIYVVSTDATVALRNTGVSVPAVGDWHHTVFQGGYAIVLNNGTARPLYILDETGNSDIANLNMYELPGWDSYHANETTIDDVYNSDIHIPEFDLGRLVNFDIEQVIVDVINPETSARRFRVTYDTLTNTVNSGATITLDSRTNTHTITVSVDSSQTNYIRDNDRLLISIRSKNITQVRASVIRSWGDTLVAGGLTEVNAPTISSVAANIITFSGEHGLSNGDMIQFPTVTDMPTYIVSGATSTTITITDLSGVSAGTAYTIVRGGTPIRNLPGVVRISDVATPGAIPHNWNPYSVGVSTADEFQLATTDTIQELAELQGNLYVYTNNTIHSLTRTGNSAIPYVANVVTTSKGALTSGSVTEFNGQHIVVGSNDIYTFSGHPASIKSIAEDRVQDYFFNSLSPTSYGLTFLLNNFANSEIWVCYAKGSSSTVDEMLIWNYKYNVWTIRRITNVLAGVIAPTIYELDNGFLSSQVDPALLRPVFATASAIFGADWNDSFTNRAGAAYESFIQRTEIPLSPEFDTEYVSSVALWVDKDVANDVPLRIRFRATMDPSNMPTDLNVGDTGPTNVPFNIGSDYKSDVRLNGRFFHYRITDELNNSDLWDLSGMQFAINKGGRR